MARRKTNKEFSNNPGKYPPWQYLKGVSLKRWYTEEQLEELLMERDIPPLRQHVGYFRQLIHSRKTGTKIFKKVKRPGVRRRIAFTCYKKLILAGSPPELEAWLVSRPELNENDRENVKERLSTWTNQQLKRDSSTSACFSVDASVAGSL